MKKIMFCAILIYGLPLSAQSGEILGKISRIDAAKNVVVISSPRAAEKFVLGDRLVVRVGNDRIILRVVFPMMTLAKCSVDQSSAGKIGMLAVGQSVYRFKNGERHKVKFYETWDDDYLAAEKKIRFIHEIPAKEVRKRNYYFEVNYDAQGSIVKTIEVKSGKRTVADYYESDRILKKEWFDEKTEKVMRIQVMAYFPSGKLRESGDYDVEKKTKLIRKYNEAGKVIEEKTEESLEE
jgi:hypothetical protein